VNKKRISEEFARILDDPKRDFTENPITEEESHALILKLFELAGNPEIPEELGLYYISCLEIVKKYVSYQ
jgi:hypothetical protein